MDPTCDGKSLEGFPVGSDEIRFLLLKKKKSLPAVWGLDCSQARMQGYQAVGQEMLGSGQVGGTETMRSEERRSVF